MYVTKKKKQKVMASSGLTINYTKTINVNTTKETMPQTRLSKITSLANILHAQIKECVELAAPTSTERDGGKKLRARGDTFILKALEFFLQVKGTCYTTLPRP